MANSTTHKAYLAWTMRKPFRSPSISTDGHTIWSYTTPIVHRLRGGWVAVNRTRYSHTTSTHQNYIAAILAVVGVRTCTMTNTHLASIPTRVSVGL